MADDDPTARTLRLIREEWTAPLQAQLDGVFALHRKQTRYVNPGYDERSFDSEEEARDWSDLSPEETVETFDVCAECSRVEWDSVSEQTDNEGYMGLTSMWPCRTAKALGLS